MYPRHLSAALAGLWLCSLPASALQGETGDSTIDPKADEFLRRMSAHLAAFEQFSFIVHETYDEVLPSGQSIQVAAVRSAFVHRPNMLATDARGDIVHREMHYDGEKLVVFDTENLVYGETEMPDTIDAVLDACATRPGADLPLAAFVRGNPYRTLMSDVETGLYLGRRIVGSKPFHHLAFTGKHVDWQLWLEIGPDPLPKKYVVTYKARPGRPQYVAVFQTWRSRMNLPKRVFSFSPPSNVQKIDHLPFGPGSRGDTPKRRTDSIE